MREPASRPIRLQNLRDKALPELPEVETVRCGLARLLPGRTISCVFVAHPRVVRSHPRGVSGFTAETTGRTFGTPARRGKYLWLPFDDGDALIAHLGMSGQFRSNLPNDPLVRNTRVRFGLSDGTELRFVDQRMFGGLTLSLGGAEAPPEIAHIALDLFDPGFDAAGVARRMRARRSTVKRALLDQTLVSGIGNIYADEALWRAKLHYATPTDRLTQRRAVELLDAAQQVMSEALAQGGTSFDALYVNVNGESGYFDRELHVYGREGQPCSRCARLIVRERFTNRSSYFCPRCQRASRSAAVA